MTTRRLAVLWFDPRGMLFRNKAARDAYVVGLSQQLGQEEAMQRWRIQVDEYNRCRSVGGSNCRDPGPPPK